MPSTIPPTADERRRAHLRAGGTAIAALLVLLLLGAGHTATAADTAVPAATPGGPANPAPAEPQPPEPVYPHRDRDHRRSPDMTSFMDHVARASLPVAVGLLVATALARGIVETRAADAELRRTARIHLDPLGFWCVMASGLNVLAIGAAGDAGLGSFALPIAIGLGAALLRFLPDADSAAAVPEAPAAAPAPPPPGAVAPATSTGWAERGEEHTAPRRLWSRR
jgi:hypothetical protein